MQLRHSYRQPLGIVSVMLMVAAALLPLKPTEVRAGEPEAQSLFGNGSDTSWLIPNKGKAKREAKLDPIVTQLGRPKPRASADLVVVVSADGLRPDAITRETHNLWELFVTGVAPHQARTIDKSATLPSHASMVSGFEPHDHGLRFNSYRPQRGRIHVPTVFSLAERAGLPSYMFVGKKKLLHLLEEDTAVSFEMSGIFCQRVVREATPTLQAAKKGIVFIHFADPDSAGHRHGWMTDEYHAAVSRTDRCVGQVVDVLEQTGRMDRTLLLVTADHGGHKRSHGTRLQSDQRIPWIARGAGANSRRRVSRQVHTTDTAATVLAALGIELPQGMHGTPVAEALGAIEGPDGLPFVGAPIE